MPYEVSHFNAPGGGIFKLSAAPTLPVPKLVQMIASACTLFGIYGGNSTAWTYTLPNPVKAGNALLVACTYDNGAGAVSVADNVNGSWPAEIGQVQNNNANSTYSSFFLITGAVAGKTTITITATNSSGMLQWDIFEFSNVTGHNGLAGTANVTGPNLATGSFTPGNNNVNGGNLIVSYFGLTTMLSDSLHAPTSWAAGTSQTLLEADVTAGYTPTAPGFTHAAQYYLQTSSVAINPGITATGDTSNGYNCIAIALTAGAAGADAPSTGIYVAKILHQSIVGAVNGTNLKLQIPWTGNLRFVSGFTGAQQVFNSFTDSDGYTWVNKASAVNDMWGYAQNVASDTNATLTIALGTHTGSNPNYTFRCYDIRNAAASAFDNYATSTGSAASSTTITNVPAITPGTSKGLTIAGIGLQTGPGLSVTSPVGANFNMVHWLGETDNDNMDNADLEASYYFSSNALQDFSWTLTSNTPNGYQAYAITFVSG